MENSRFLRKKCAKVLIVGFFGSALFVMLTIAAISSYLPLEPSLLTMLPTIWVIGLFGGDSGELSNSGTIMLGINALFGLFVFGTPAAFWQFILRGNDEK